MTAASAVSFLLLVALVSVTAAAASSSGTKYKWTWKAALNITAFDGVILAADAFVPLSDNASQLFPAVIFPNSWGQPQIEYIVRALGLAELGYVALEYETRGWYDSGGFIDTAGPKDREDGKSMLDFVISKAADWKVDTTKIAFMGISYGAGISLMMAGTDPRVTTALALSGWNNITDMIFGNDCPNRGELESLYNSGVKHGKVAPELGQMLHDVLHHEDMSFVFNFSSRRSPQTYLESLNARQVPLFISSNYMDRIFRPQYMLEFFDVLTVPKRMLMNQGGHAIPEAIGLFLHDNAIWQHAFKWLAYWLKGEDNGIMSEPAMQLQLGASMIDKTYVPFSGNPNADPTVNISSYYFCERLSNAFGGLAPNCGSSGSSGGGGPGQGNTISFTHQPDLKSGQKDDKEEALGLPFDTNLTAANASTSVVFLSEPLVAATRVCGTPSMALQLNASASAYQIYGFFYDVFAWTDGSMIGTLLSEAFWTHYADSTIDSQRVQFHTLCRDVPAGHQLGVGFVLFTKQFEPANTSSALQVQVLAGRFDLPVVVSP